MPFMLAIVTRVALENRSSPMNRNPLVITARPNTSNEALINQCSTIF